MFAPKGTPDATIKKLTRDFKAVLADPDVRRKWARRASRSWPPTALRWMPM